MQKFLIHESNLERLEKKLQSIQKKCNKNQFSFCYNRLGEQYITSKDAEGREYTAKYIEVEVEGTVRHNGWEFVAVIDHHEAGNVIRACKTDVEIPERYRTCGPTCEHCNRIRSRKDTYIVYNEETKEFKQVGKSCLTEYTRGLDAEDVARLMQCFEEMEKGYGYSGSGYTSYINRDEILRYAWECFRHFGYERSTDDFGNYNIRSTRSRVDDYRRANSAHLRSWMHPTQLENILAEMQQVGFDADSDYAKKMTEESVQWILSSENYPNGYLNNLRIICSEEYVASRDLGILVSLTVTYNRHLKDEEYKEKQAQKVEKEAAASAYQGEVGDRLNIQLESAELISSFDGHFGTAWMYKFVDKSGNIYIWYASTPIDTEDELTSLVGTVKAHNEYKGVKQTVLTRCKVS